MALTILDIETGLEERYNLQGHDVRFVEWTDTWSKLGCKTCLKSVVVSVNEFGGWMLSNEDLDKKCRPNQPTKCKECDAVDQSGYNGSSDRCICPGDETP